MSEEKFSQYIKGNEDSSSSSAWMMSLADLLSLLLVFFLLIYSMSSIKTGEWKDLKRSMEGKFSLNRIIESKFSTSKLGIDRLEIKFAADLGYLYAIMNTKMQEDGFLERNVKLDYAGDTITVSFNIDELFIEGQNVLTNDAELLLFDLSEILRKAGNRIDIEDIAHHDGSMTLEKKISQAIKRATIIAEELKAFGNKSNMGIEIKTSTYSANGYKTKLVIRDYVK